jgi:SAM-dependent methyltransferase
MSHVQDDVKPGDRHHGTPPASPALDEAQALAGRYARRQGPGSGAADRDSLLHPAAVAMWAERQQALAALLREQGMSAAALGERRVLELGCGAGGNLADLIRLGAAPERCAGIDLLPDRLAMARVSLPPAVQLRQGDAASYDPEALGLAREHDLVLLFTVLSSVLDADVRAQLLARAWQAVAPGGALLVYDFVVDNPRNPDVRRVRVADVVRSAPRARATVVRRLTLAPPLARWASRWHPGLYNLLNAVPWLRTHRLIWLGR